MSARIIDFAEKRLERQLKDKDLLFRELPLTAIFQQLFQLERTRNRYQKTGEHEAVLVYEAQSGRHTNAPSIAMSDDVPVRFAGFG